MRPQPRNLCGETTISLEISTLQNAAAAPCGDKEQRRG